MEEEKEKDEIEERANLFAKEERFQKFSKQIIEEMQEKGYCLIDDFFTQEIFDNILKEYSELEVNALKKIEENKLDSILLEPTLGGKSLIETIKQFFSHQLRELLNKESFNYKPITKGNYYHPYKEMKLFQGYKEAQFRIRTSGGLGLHMDRTCAEITILYYLNSCEGGDLRMNLLPKDKYYYEGADEWICRAFELCDEIIDLIPLPNRFIAFWSNSIPHEVLSVYSPRAAFQVFYSVDRFHFGVDPLLLNDNNNNLNNYNNNINDNNSNDNDNNDDNNISGVVS